MLSKMLKWVTFEFLTKLGRFFESEAVLGQFRPNYGSNIFGRTLRHSKIFDFASKFSNFNELNLFDFFVGCYYFGGQQMFLFSIRNNLMMPK